MPDKPTLWTALFMYRSKMQALSVIGLFNDPARTAYGLRHVSSFCFRDKFGGIKYKVKAKGIVR